MGLINDIYPYFDIIDSYLSNVNKYEYIGDNFDKLPTIHNDIGKWILELIYKNRRLYNILLCAGIHSEETMSMFVLEMYYLYLNECI